METQLQTAKNKVDSFDNQISNYCAQITELNKKIINLEQQKVELNKTKSLPTMEAINQEVGQQRSSTY